MGNVAGRLTANKGVMTMENPRQYTIYVDGACTNNGKASALAGWGAILRNSKGEERELAGPVPKHDPQTNIRAELLAFVLAVEWFKQPSTMDVYTDNEMVAKGYSEWMDGWIAKGWRGSKGPVAHSDLWRRVQAMREVHTIRVHWVRGHSGVVDTERADRLAGLGAQGQMISRKVAAPVADAT